MHAALERGVPLLLAHEMPGFGQEERYPCEFSAFFSCERGTTPQELIRRGIYQSIAVPLKGNEWREASMRMLGMSLAADVAAHDSDGGAAAEPSKAQGGRSTGTGLAQKGRSRRTKIVPG